MAPQRPSSTGPDDFFAMLKAARQRTAPVGRSLIGLPEETVRSAAAGGARSGAHWVRPEIVVEIAFGHWTNDGRLRHPVYLGQRTDVDPHQVVREPAAT